MSEIETLAKGLSEKACLAILSLTDEFQSPRGVSRQSVAALWWRHPKLVEREWQDGCAQCTYYRLPPLGIQVRDYLKAHP